MTAQHKHGSRTTRRVQLGSAILLLAFWLLVLPSCYTARTLWGGAGILARRKPVEKVLAGDELSIEQRRKLELTQQLLDFAVSDLQLVADRSYKTFVRVDGPYVMWNVVAAPELSIEPLTWCFPIAGCVSYRGYFKKARAVKFAEKLERKGNDVQVGGVDAYSTLGWFRDPILSTFLVRRDVELAALLFHELAHQRLYIKDDTTFNESFATVVELEGVRRWLEAQGRGDELTEWHRQQQIERQFVELVTGCRRRLDEIYRSALPEGDKRHRKNELLADLGIEYEQAKRDWGGDDRYDAWFERPLNNAHLATVADYHDLVVPLTELLRRSGGAMEEFYAQAEQLRDLDREERRRRLQRPSP